MNLIKHTKTFHIYVVIRKSIYQMIRLNFVKLLVIFITDFKCYPSTYCLMQGSCFICSNF